MGGGPKEHPGVRSKIEKVLCVFRNPVAGVQRGAGVPVCVAELFPVGEKPRIGVYHTTAILHNHIRALGYPLIAGINTHCKFWL